MKILVAVADYPRLDKSVAMMFVHTRNKCYIENGLKVTVLNFAATEGYIIDGIPVITYEDYVHGNDKYDALLCHAPNIRNHFIFLKRYGDKFKRKIFFFHGHEVLRCSKVYSKPYFYQKASKPFEVFFREAYDSFKLWLWHGYFKNNFSCELVFVSEWMKKEFLKWTHLSEKNITSKHYVIYNCIGKEFENEQYCYNGSKKYDFVSIRSNFDGSKYCVDLIRKLALKNPKFKFLLVGKGKYFLHYDIPDNLEVRYEYLNHEEIVNVLNSAKFALMPTRTDAQGVMACEINAFGIPMITSNINVCNEIFGDCKNVFLISNDEAITLDNIYANYDKACKCQKNHKYFEENTTHREISLLKGRL